MVELMARVLVIEDQTEIRELFLLEVGARLDFLLKVLVHLRELSGLFRTALLDVGLPAFVFLGCALLR